MGEKIIKAVIPAAGRGTRMRGIHAGVPKEMLKIGTKPAIQYVVEEAYLSGIREMAIIVNPRKDLIVRYFSEETSVTDPESRETSLLEKIKRNTRFTFLHQASPDGAADAVYQAREFVGEEPFALLFPDNIVFTSRPAIGQLMDIREKTGCRGAVCGLHRIGREEAGDFGNCGGVELGSGHQDLWPVLRVQSKGKGQFRIPPSGQGIRMFPRHILTPKFFPWLKKRPGEPEKEK